MKRLIISILAVFGLMFGTAATASAIHASPAKAADTLTITVQKHVQLNMSGTYDGQIAWIEYTISGLNPGDAVGPNGNVWLAATLTQDRPGNGNEFVQGTGYGWSNPVPQGGNSVTAEVPIMTVQGWGNNGVYKLGKATVSGYVSRSDGLYQSYSADVILGPEAAAG